MINLKKNNFSKFTKEILNSENKEKNLFKKKEKKNNLKLNGKITKKNYFENSEKNFFLKNEIFYKENLKNFDFNNIINYFHFLEDLLNLLQSKKNNEKFYKQIPEILEDIIFSDFEKILKKSQNSKISKNVKKLENVEKKENLVKNKNSKILKKGENLEKNEILIFLKKNIFFLLIIFCNKNSHKKNSLIHRSLFIIIENLYHFFQLIFFFAKFEKIEINLKKVKILISKTNPKILKKKLFLIKNNILANSKELEKNINYYLQILYNKDDFLKLEKISKKNFSLEKFKNSLCDFIKYKKVIKNLKNSFNKKNYEEIKKKKNFEENFEKKKNYNKIFEKNLKNFKKNIFCKENFEEIKKDTFEIDDFEDVKILKEIYIEEKIEKNSENSLNSSLSKKYYKKIYKNKKKTLNTKNTPNSSKNSKIDTSLSIKSFFGEDNQPLFIIQPKPEIPKLLPLKKKTQKISKNQNSQKTTKTPKFTLILDLDETLIHFEESQNGGQFFVRPHTQNFLKKMSKIYEIVIFTAAIKSYADYIINKIDKNCLISYRLYRKHTILHNNLYIKDLSNIGRDLSKVIIVDNNKDNFILQPENGILIKSWYNDPEDKALLGLGKVLEGVVKSRVEDCREYLKGVHEKILVKYQIE